MLGRGVADVCASVVDVHANRSADLANLERAFFDVLVERPAGKARVGGELIERDESTALGGVFIFIAPLGTTAVLSGPRIAIGLKTGGTGGRSSTR